MNQPCWRSEVKKTNQQPAGGQTGRNVRFRFIRWCSTCNVSLSLSRTRTHALSVDQQVIDLISETPLDKRTNRRYSNNNVSDEVQTQSGPVDRPAPCPSASSTSPPFSCRPPRADAAAVAAVAAGTRPSSGRSDRLLCGGSRP